MDNNQELIIRKLREDQEKNKQHIYESRRKIQSFEALQKEYQEEIDRLNIDKVKLTQKLQIQTEKNFEEICLLRKNYSEQKHTALEELVDAKSKIELLRDSIHLVKNTHIPKEPDESITEHIQDLKNKKTQLESKIDLLNHEATCSRKNHDELKETQQALEKINECLRETLIIKKTDLEQSKVSIQNLQDDVICLKSELDSVKNKPLDAQSRGNSLFAEVYDSRERLKKQLVILDRKRNEIVNSYENVLQEIQSLKSEKTELIKKLQNEVGVYDSESQDEINTYKSKIFELMTIIKSSKQEIELEEETDDISTCNDLRYHVNYLKDKKNELKSLREKLEDHATCHVLRNQEFTKTCKERTIWKLKIIDLETENKILQTRMKQLEEESRGISEVKVT